MKSKIRPKWHKWTRWSIGPSRPIWPVGAGMEALLPVLLLGGIGVSLFGAPPVPRPLPAKPKPPTENKVANPPMTVVTSSFPVPKFEVWPALPPSEPTLAPFPMMAPHRGPEKPVVPSTVRDNTLYSFQAENLELKSALALFARANKLNIVPDQDVTGQVTLDVYDLSLEKLMQALLEAQDVSWTDQGGLIRVRSVQTRHFAVDYLRLVRTGHGSSAISLSSAVSNSGGGGGSGSGGGGGGGAGGGGSGGGAGGGAGGGGNISQMNLSQENPVEFWKELEEQLNKLLTKAGNDSLAINKTAGLIQITDRPSALTRVADFLEKLSESIAREVDLEVKLYDVTLNDQFQFGIDWQKVAIAGSGQFKTVGSPFGNPSDLNLTRSSFIQPGGGFAVNDSALTLAFNNQNASAVLQALKSQGEVSVISQPRLRTLNNQTAILKVGTDQPFFAQQTQIIQASGSLNQQSGDVLSIITVGTVLSVTPQISADGWITLDITPAITSFVSEKKSLSGRSSAPLLDIKQSSTIVRLRDGETTIMGGLIQNTKSTNTRKIPVLGDIPLLGKLFQGQFEAKQKKELVIFLTPRIVK